MKRNIITVLIVGIIIVIFIINERHEQTIDFTKSENNILRKFFSSEDKINNFLNTEKKEFKVPDKNLKQENNLSILKSVTNKYLCLRENSITNHKTKSECWDGELLSEKELEYIDSISSDLKNINEIFYYCKENGFKISNESLDACGIFLEKKVSEIDTTNNNNLSNQIDEIKNSVKNIDKRQKWEKFLKLLKANN